MPTEASQGQIKKAYYQRARECHPDKHAGDDAKAEEFKRLSDAYQTLFDNERRAAYDLHGKAGEQGGTWVDPRDLYAATFGGPEFEPWVGVLGAQPPDELVQAAERAAAAAVAKAEELSALQRQGDAGATAAAQGDAGASAAAPPASAVSTCAQELEEAQRAAREAAAALDSAAKALQPPSPTPTLTLTLTLTPTLTLTLTLTLNPTLGKLQPIVCATTLPQP